MVVDGRWACRVSGGRRPTARRCRRPACPPGPHILGGRQVELGLELGVAGRPLVEAVDAMAMRSRRTKIGAFRWKRSSCARRACRGVAHQERINPWSRSPISSSAVRTRRGRRSRPRGRRPCSVEPDKAVVEHIDPIQRPRRARSAGVHHRHDSKLRATCRNRQLRAQEPAAVHDQVGPVKKSASSSSGGPGRRRPDRPGGPAPSPRWRPNRRRASAPGPARSADPHLLVSPVRARHLTSWTGAALAAQWAANPTMAVAGHVVEATITPPRPRMSGGGLGPEQEALGGRVERGVPQGLVDSSAGRGSKPPGACT